MKKALIGIGLVLITVGALAAEGFTLYTGKANNTSFIGLMLGGEIGDFLLLQVDAMKYLKDDPSLHNDDQTLNRGDFVGVSGNCTIKLPIHLIPHLDRFDYIQPYLSIERGFYSENYHDVYNKLACPVDGKTGFFSKLRSFSSFGYGVVVMLSPQFGLKADYQRIKVEAHTSLALPGRKFGRLAFGICIGPYKKPIKRIKR